jgi:hypothetical protein
MRVADAVTTSEHLIDAVLYGALVDELALIGTWAGWSLTAAVQAQAVSPAWPDGLLAAAKTLPSASCPDGVQKPAARHHR